jgi:hypothetical protein
VPNTQWQAYVIAEFPLNYAHPERVLKITGLFHIPFPLNELRVRDIPRGGEVTDIRSSNILVEASASGLPTGPCFYTRFYYNALAKSAIAIAQRLNGQTTLTYFSLPFDLK